MVLIVAMPHKRTVSIPDRDVLRRRSAVSVVVVGGVRDHSLPRYCLFNTSVISSRLLQILSNT